MHAQEVDSYLLNDYYVPSTVIVLNKAMSLLSGGRHRSERKGLTSQQANTQSGGNKSNEEN